jgi:hypothetical protein
MDSIKEHDCPIKRHFLRELVRWKMKYLEIGRVLLRCAVRLLPSIKENAVVGAVGTFTNNTER